MPLERSQLRHGALGWSWEAGLAQFFHWRSQVTSGKASLPLQTRILPCQTRRAELTSGPSQQSLWVQWEPLSRMCPSVSLLWVQWEPLSQCAGSCPSPNGERHCVRQLSGAFRVRFTCPPHLKRNWTGAHPHQSHCTPAQPLTLQVPFPALVSSPTKRKTVLPARLIRCRERS